MGINDEQRAVMDNMARDNLAGFRCGYSEALSQVNAAMDNARAAGNHAAVDLIYDLVYRPLSDHRPAAIEAERANWVDIIAATTARIGG